MTGRNMADGKMTGRKMRRRSNKKILGVVQVAVEQGRIGRTQGNEADKNGNEKVRKSSMAQRRWKILPGGRIKRWKASPQGCEWMGVPALDTRAMDAPFCNLVRICGARSFSLCS